MSKSTNKVGGRAFLNEAFIGGHAHAVWLLWDGPGVDRFGGYLEITDCTNTARIELCSGTKDEYLRVLGLLDTLAGEIEGAKNSHLKRKGGAGQAFLLPPIAEDNMNCFWLLRLDEGNLIGRLHVESNGTRVILDLHSRSERHYLNVAYKLDTLLLVISNLRREYHKRGLALWGPFHGPEGSWGSYEEVERGR